MGVPNVVIRNRQRVGSFLPQNFTFGGDQNPTLTPWAARKLHRHQQRTGIASTHTSRNPGPDRRRESVQASILHLCADRRLLADSHRGGCRASRCRSRSDGWEHLLGHQLCLQLPASTWIKDSLIISRSLHLMPRHRRRPPRQPRVRLLVRSLRGLRPQLP